jgi:hypothetical protein
MHFTSSTLLKDETASRPAAVFSCTAAELQSRHIFMHYAPVGCVNENIILSLSDYISVNVMHAELEAFKREMELLMRPSEVYLAALADDPAT